MPQDSDRRRAYERARDAFEDLKPEDQARFLFETTTSAVSRGVVNVSRALADELEDFLRRNPRSNRKDTHRGGESKTSSEASSAADARRDPPGAAEPPTDAQRAPGGPPESDA